MTVRPSMRTLRATVPSTRSSSRAISVEIVTPRFTSITVPAATVISIPSGPGSGTATGAVMVAAGRCPVWAASTVGGCGGAAAGGAGGGGAASGLAAGFAVSVLTTTSMRSRTRFRVPAIAAVGGAVAVVPAGSGPRMDSHVRFSWWGLG